MKKHRTDAKTEISYTLIGDYYIPNLIPQATEDFPIGRFGRERARYLREHRKVLYTQLLTQGKLNRYLHETDMQAEELYSGLLVQYAKAQGVTEQLKAENQMEWVGGMNNIASAVTEVVRAEVIYC